MYMLYLRTWSMISEIVEAWKFGVHFINSLCEPRAFVYAPQSSNLDIIIPVCRSKKLGS